MATIAIFGNSWMFICLLGLTCVTHVMPSQGMVKEHRVIGLFYFECGGYDFYSGPSLRHQKSWFCLVIPFPSTANVNRMGWKNYSVF